MHCPSFLAQVASEKSAPVPVGASSSWSVMGIYLGRSTTAVTSCAKLPLEFLATRSVQFPAAGVVYTIGRLLRVVFQERALYWNTVGSVLALTLVVKLGASWSYAFHGGQNLIHTDASIF